ncbi:hypothetical protein WH297_19180 [Ochrobactrum vermis]|uniref:Uncharacterized protein n=1 Tax=Ochrobactrum vermis TaxID=1827297 RepID=A0ABU8PHW4_9HYPH|nr:hypothetical protein [Ochrobactrum vermis]PQZ26155.1 hypothetical protein CQZ93_19470 [Ochrobactrum vermis]
MKGLLSETGISGIMLNADAVHPVVAIGNGASTGTELSAEWISKRAFPVLGTIENGISVHSCA